MTYVDPQPQPSAALLDITLCAEVEQTSHQLCNSILIYYMLLLRINCDRQWSNGIPAAPTVCKVSTSFRLHLRC